LWRWERRSSLSSEEVERQHNNLWFEKVEGGATRDRWRENILERPQRERERESKSDGERDEERARECKTTKRES
jgi:hypothetical protein